MDRLKVIFAGTGAFGVPVLQKLASSDGFEIPFVITGMDKEAGRGLSLKKNAIKQTALLNKLIVHQTRHMADLKERIVEAQPDFLLVVAFGEIIPKEILSIPGIGAVNIHGSLLPKYRGASPIQEALLQQEKITGITWMRMDEKMDHGPIIAISKMEILEDDTAEILSGKLAELAAEKTGGILEEFAKTKKSAPQDESKATYCRKIKREDGFLDPLKERAADMLSKIRAYTPWPGCSIVWNGKRLKIIEAKMSSENLAPGEIRVKDGKILMLGTREGTLLPGIIQPESKQKMRVEEFLRGLKKIDP